MAIEEELSLNIDSALEAIDRMAQGLQEALIGFFAAFDDAVKQLGSATIPLPFEAEVEGGQQPVFEEQQDVVVDADEGSAEGAAAGISEDLSQIEGAASVDVEGDASGLQSEISEAVQIDESPEVTVGIDADFDAAQSEADSYRSSAEEPIVVEASIEDAGSVGEFVGNMELAQEGALGVADGLDEASNAGENTSESVEKVSQSTKKAKEEADELEKSWQKVAVIGAQVFAGLVAGTAAAAAGYAQAAIQFEGAYTGFAAQLGSLSTELKQIDVQGFSSDLGSLVQNLGSSDEAVLGVVQRVALLGQNADATNEQISETTSNLVGVAAAIRATNPQFGELDQIAQRLANGFQRGVTTLARYGINLSEQEVRARAALQTNKAMTAEFSRFELTAAAASIAAEQFGGSIKENIENASKNPIIEMERLQEVFGDAIEQIGRPLVIPFLNAIDEGTPLVLEFLRVVANFAQSFFPFVDEVIAVGKELTGPLTDSANTVIDDLIPAFEEFAEALGNVVEGIEPAILLFSNLSQVSLSLLAKVLEGLSMIINELGEDLTGFIIIGALLVRNVQFMISTFTKLYATLFVNPWLAVAAGIALITAAIIEFNRGPDPFDELVRSAVAAIVVIEDIPPALREATASVEEYIRTQEILEDKSIAKALARTGISVEQFSEAVAGGTEGARELVGLLLATGQQGLTTAEGLKVTTDNLNELTDAELRSINTYESTGEVLFDRTNAVQVLLNKYGDFTRSLNATNEAIFNQAAATAGLTPELVEVIKNTNRLSDGTVDYDAALQDLLIRTERTIRMQEMQKEISGETAEQNRIFAEGVSEIATQLANGTITAEDFTNALGTAGLTIEEVETIVEQLAEEMNAFVDGATARVPTVAEAFKDLGPDNTAQSLIDSFNTQIDETNRWNAEMTRLRREGQSDILQVVAELGPQQGLLLLDAYRDNETQLADHLRNMAAAEQAALQATREVAVLNWLETREITGAAAEAVVAELEDKLVLADATETSIQEAIRTVEENSPELANAFGEAGADAADALTVQSAEELNAKAGELNAAVEAVWSGAGGVAETASRIAAEAGVNQFNEIVQTGFLNSEVASTIIQRVSTTFSATGISVGSSFGEGVRFGMLLQQASVVNTAVTLLTDAESAAFRLAQQAGRRIGAEFVNGIRDQIRAARDFNVISSVVTALISDFETANILVARFAGIGIGASFVGGLVDAIRSGSSSVSSAARKIISDAEIAAKAEAESDSPSKVWERLGKDLVSGLAKGLTNSGFLAANAASGVISQATPNATSPAGNSISISVPVTVSGGMTADQGREIGTEAGRAVGAELVRMMRLEGLRA